MRCTADDRRGGELSWPIRVKTHSGRANAQLRASAALEISGDGNARSFDSTGTAWQATHGALIRLARSRARLDFEAGELRAAERARVHQLSHGRAHVGIRRVDAIAWLVMACS
jgi:hypothetical protein